MKSMFNYCTYTKDCDKVLPGPLLKSHRIALLLMSGQIYIFINKRTF